MRIPKKIKIGGHDILILRHAENQNDWLGFYDARNNTISLTTDTRITESALAEGFLHEILEAINNKYESKLDHQALTVLSEVLFAVLRDNDLGFHID